MKCSHRDSIITRDETLKVNHERKGGLYSWIRLGGKWIWIKLHVSRLSNIPFPHVFARFIRSEIRSPDVNSTCTNNLQFFCFGRLSVLWNLQTPELHNWRLDLFRNPVTFRAIARVYELKRSLALQIRCMSNTLRKSRKIVQRVDDC